MNSVASDKLRVGAVFLSGDRPGSLLLGGDASLCLPYLGGGYTSLPLLLLFMLYHASTF